jgi:hypothetical protein
MRFQNRDGHILLKIYENDGVLARRHLKGIFWPDTSTRAMEVRLSKLQRNNYISWPTREHQKTMPIPEPICWLGWRGAQYIAGLHGVEVDSINSNSENRLRVFQKQLRDNGIRWVREPRWSLLRHDLAIFDFRLAVEKSADELQSINLENWVTESVFRSDMDVVEYKVRSQSGGVKTLKRGVCPDAYFEIVNEEHHLRGDDKFKLRCLLELDMATHSNPSFGRDKARPYASYIKSPKYKSRFGLNNGMWLIVTSGQEKRLQNLIHQTKEKTGDNSGMFLFTSLNQLAIGNMLTSPIWRQIDNDNLMPLLAMTY